MKTIELGKTYDAYNDGKISPSRLVRVKITDVVRREDLGRHWWKVWKDTLSEDMKRARKGCIHYYIGDGNFTSQMWDWNNELFYFGYIPGDKETEEDDPMMFAKTSWGVWYGVNWNFKLDVSGRIRKNNIKNWKLCAKEMGQTMKWNAKEGHYDYFDIQTGKKRSE